MTGASKGIGKSIAIALANEGVKVVLSARNLELLLNVQSTIQEMGGMAISVTTDVTSEKSVQNLIVETEKAFGKMTSLSITLV